MVAFSAKIREVKLRRFVLQRNEDVSGVSGTGVVAEGIQFTDGVCVIRWKTVPIASTAVYDSVDDLIGIHGHEGATQISWIDQPFSNGGVITDKDITDPGEDFMTQLHRARLDEFYGKEAEVLARYSKDIPAVWRTDGLDV